MDVIESLIARLGLDTSEFKEGMVKSGEAVSMLNEKMESLQKGLAAGAIGEFIHHQLEGAAATVHFADNVGVSTDALQAFTFAAHEHSVSQEEANRVWTASKRALDQLQEGLPKAREDFALLGLSAQDFVGLSLDKSVERIAKGFVENEQAAGAYDAMQSIVGRTGRNLTSTLVELGEQGFGALIAGAKEAHAVIEEKTLRDLEETNREWEAIVNTMKTGSAAVIGFLQNVVGTLTDVAYGFYLIDKAIVTGRLFSAEGAAQTKVQLQAIGHEINEIWTGTERAAAAAEKHSKAIGEQKEALIEAAAVQGAREKYEEAIAAAQNRGLDASQKLANLADEIYALELKAAASAGDRKKYYEEMAAVAKLIGEYRKEDAKRDEEDLAEALKRVDAERSRLPVYQQADLLQQEISAAVIAEREAKEKGYDITKFEALVQQKRNDLWKNSVELAKEEAKAVFDLVSLDPQRVANAKVLLDLVRGRTTQEANEGELFGLLAKGAENLTEQEKLHAKALFDNLDPLKQQEVLKNLIISDTEHLTDQEKEVLRVLQGQTAEVKNQVAAVGSLIDAWTAFRTSVSDSSNPQNESTAQLQYELANLKSDFGKMQAEGQGSSYFDAQGNAIFGTPTILQAKIKTLENELAARANFNRDVSLYGQAGAQSLLGISPDEFQRLLQATQAMSGGVSQLNQRLGAAGFTTTR